MSTDRKAVNQLKMAEKMSIVYTDRNKCQLYVRLTFFFCQLHLIDTFLLIMKKVAFLRCRKKVVTLLPRFLVTYLLRI